MLPLLSSATVVRTFGQMLVTATPLTPKALSGENNSVLNT